VSSGRDEVIAERVQSDQEQTYEYHVSFRNNHLVETSCFEYSIPH
jgi:hypothetical protein